MAAPMQPKLNGVKVLARTPLARTLELSMITCIDTVAIKVEKTMIPKVSTRCFPMGYCKIFGEDVALSVKSMMSDDKISMRASAVVAKRARDPEVMAAVTKCQKCQTKFIVNTL